jgi:nicotinate phosphoribosyltransferase
LNGRAPSSALLTDHYELTMLEAALRSGIAAHEATFEVFARRLPPGRAYGVFAGLGRLLVALEAFRFGPDELEWLGSRRIVSEPTLDWLAGFRFGGRIDAYREGELYTAGSPVLTVTAPFGEAVLVETLVLSILNFDSAVAAAGARIVDSANGRPVIEMGSRRIDPDAAVAAARAAYLVGFASTSNLEAGRRWGVPTAGTSSHAFVLAHASEREAFDAQVEALGAGTTLLVDTYDLDEGVRTAVAAAGDRLGAIRIDSGDLATEARRARRMLDELGAGRARLVATGDLDDRSIAALSDSPVDAYGVGTHVVTGLGWPTAGLVYKLVAIGGDPDSSHPVAKRSPGKATVGGRKWAWRATMSGPVPGAVPPDDRPPLRATETVLVDVVALDQGQAPPRGRPLQETVLAGGRQRAQPALEAVRAWHEQVRAELAPGQALWLLRMP